MTLMGGDFTRGLPEGPFDLVLLSNVCRIYGPEENRQLFQRVADVLVPRGGAAIIDFVRGRSPAAALFGVNMPSSGGNGDTWTEAEYRAWLAEAGFGEIQVEDIGASPEEINTKQRQQYLTALTAGPIVQPWWGEIRQAQSGLCIGQCWPGGIMAASKSKRRKGKQKQSQRQSPIEHFRQKLAEGPTRGMEFIVEPEGQVRMSEVLELFVDPYLDFAQTAGEKRKLFTVAVLAWNASFLPPGEQEKMIDEVVSAGLPQDAASVKADLMNIVNELIARKRALFAENTRKIVNFQLIETPNGFHLSVASTL